jgi:hypothetical protein
MVKNKNLLNLWKKLKRKVISKDTQPEASDTWTFKFDDLKYLLFHEKFEDRSNEKQKDAALLPVWKKLNSYFHSPTQPQLKLEWILYQILLSDY